MGKHHKKTLKNNSHNNNFIARQVTATQFSGPLPPPEMLQKYNEIVPGAAERIITMAEKQAEHRRELEKNVITADIKSSKRGSIFGLIIALAGLLSATICALFDKQIAAATIGGADLVSLVGVFIYGTRQRKKERQEKEEKRVKILEGNISE